MKSIQIITFLGASALAACGGSKAAEDLKKAADDLAAAQKPAEPAAKPTEPATPPAPTGPEPAADKDYLGFDMQPMGDWKPTWDAEAKTAKWENDNYMHGILVRIAREKLDNLDDLKKEAPMMGQIGTAITSVKEQGTTANGFWAVVESDEGKGLDYVSVQKFGSKTIVCSAGLGSSMGDAIKVADAKKACESLKLK